MVLLVLVCPMFSNIPYHPSWVGSPNGNFSSISAYKILHNDDSENSDWMWIWKLKVPAKLYFFIWLVLHSCLPINSLRASRGMIPMNYCPRCDDTPEDLNHLFRGCPKAKELWHSICDDTPSVLRLL